MNNLQFNNMKEMNIDEFILLNIYHGMHNHTHYSNLRLRDATAKVENLIDTAILLNHKGINISEHESLSSHVEAMNYRAELYKKKDIYNKMKKEGATEEKIKKEIGKKYEVVKKMSDEFIIGLGNEIYLVDSLEECRDNYQSGVTKFYHFVLMAKNKRGHEALRILSSHAWGNLFLTGKMERVPTEKDFLRKIMKEYKGDVIGSTACLGSELGQTVLELLQVKAREHTDEDLYNIKLKIHNYINFCLDVFGKDFAIEVQPSSQIEQIEFNKMALVISKAYKIPLIITTDTHYLRPEDREVHKYYLLSKDGERETDDFYSSTYLMSLKEIWEYWKLFGTEEDFKTAVLNTSKMFEEVENYDLSKGEVVPERVLPKYFKLEHIFKKWYDKYDYIKKFAYSEYEQDNFFLYLIEKGFISKKQEFNETNINRINIELKEIWLISERLHQRMAGYYNLTELLIRIMWDDEGGNSIVGIARGSVTGYYTCFLVGITQINPITWDLPHWRHL